jgi:hypothetical protein
MLDMHTINSNVMFLIDIICYESIEAISSCLACKSDNFVCEFFSESTLIPSKPTNRNIV